LLQPATWTSASTSMRCHRTAEKTRNSSGRTATSWVTRPPRRMRCWGCVGHR
jgi:hypothetical protein